MSKRYNCCLGASTTAGGVIVAASGQGRIEGRELAVEGDPIHCPACNRLGRILCVPPRTSEIWHGKQAALEGDLCICQCEPPPKLIANQKLKSNSTDEGEPPPPPPEHAATQDYVSPYRFEIQYQLVSETTGKPHVGMPYRIDLQDNSFRTGLTDSLGMTQLIVSTQCMNSTLTAPYHDDNTQTFDGEIGSDACCSDDP